MIWTVSCTGLHPIQSNLDLVRGHWPPCRLKGTAKCPLRRRLRQHEAVLALQITSACAWMPCCLPLELLKTTRRLNHAASRSFQQQTIYCSGSRCTGHVYYMYILYIYNACANVCTYSCIYVYIYTGIQVHIY